MLGLILFIVIAYLISNFVHLSALREEYKHKGFLGALSLSLAIIIHQIASLFIRG